ncbi:hypothetical protein L596_021145 [Steinernema carpocapsae]|uniref:Methyltransferase domain-containing protein n=1 Tax=Steinernema carpocapsae TaxID=34508 RepID=A0A4U5MVK6_STECR|nr:hypothetical protein L596_021145 [Steinernema carpocapsae]
MNASIIPALISSETDESVARYSFSDLLKKYNHSMIDIIKIDIERGEYDVLDQIIQVPICQILIEVHGWANDISNLLTTLSKVGYYLFHHEINSVYIEACEYSLIHEKCIKDYGVDVVLGRYLS